MNFVADESCAGPVIRALRKAGHDVVAIAEVAKGAKDEQVLERALNRGRTRNRPANHNNRGRGEIFRTDFTGDGSVQDPIPGTHVGSFGRGIDASSINSVIANYNNT